MRPGAVFPTAGLRELGVDKGQGWASWLVAPERWDGLFQALRDLGYVEGKNILIEFR